MIRKRSNVAREQSAYDMAPRPRFTLLLALICSFGGFLTPTQADDVPVAPLQSEEALGYEKAYVLENDYLKVIIVPEIGRLAYLSYQNSPNLLTQRTLTPKAGEWANYGGAWLWPMAQTRWLETQENNMPPPKGFDGRPWKARAWKNADGTQNVLLIQEYPAPHNIKVTFQIKLHANDPAIHFKQRMDRFEAGTQSMTLWNLVQVANPEALFFPISKGGPFEDGYDLIMGQIDSNSLTTCEATVNIDLKTHEGELKLGGSSEEPWCALLAQKHVLHFSTPPLDPKANYPDNGCASQIYLAGDQSYAELELLSEEKNLGPGEHLEQSFILQVTPHKKLEEPCDAKHWTP